MLDAEVAAEGGNLALDATTGCRFATGDDGSREGGNQFARVIVGVQVEAE
ncbi:MAG: hypothetical protein IPL78_32845 [Chloroflexi bacterium]|nr:hypothetical protein [Chloroflexota bacterium]